MLHKTHLVADEISREPQTIVLLAWVNYRGVYAILNINFSINMIRFRKLWPLGSISRGYVHPFHPITAIVLLVLCVAVYFATYLGYTKMLLSIMVFYILASLWFAYHRYQYVKRGDQFTMAWPRPKGY